MAKEKNHIVSVQKGKVTFTSLKKGLRKTALPNIVLVGMWVVYCMNTVQVKFMVDLNLMT